MDNINDDIDSFEGLDLDQLSDAERAVFNHSVGGRYGGGETLDHAVRSVYKGSKYDITYDDVAFYTREGNTTETYGVVDSFFRGVRGGLRQTGAALKNIFDPTIGFETQEEVDEYNSNSSSYDKPGTVKVIFGHPVNTAPRGELDEVSDDLREMIGDAPGIYTNEAAFDYLETLDLLGTKGLFAWVGEQVADAPLLIAGGGLARGAGILGKGLLNVAGKATKGALSKTIYGDFIGASFANTLNKISGTKAVQFLSTNIAKKAMSSSAREGTTMAFYSLGNELRKSYVLGVPMENIGSSVAWNALLGVLFGAGNTLILKPGYQWIKNSVKSGIATKMSNAWVPSKIKIAEKGEKGAFGEDTPAKNVRLTREEYENGVTVENKDVTIIPSATENKAGKWWEEISSLSARHFNSESQTLRMFAYRTLKSSKFFSETGVENHLILEGYVDNQKGKIADILMDINDAYLPLKKKGIVSDKEELGKLVYTEYTSGKAPRSEFVTIFKKIEEAEAKNTELLLEQGMYNKVIQKRNPHLFDENGNPIRKLTREDLQPQFHEDGTPIQKRVLKDGERAQTYLYRGWDVDRIVSSRENIAKVKEILVNALKRRNGGRELSPEQMRSIEEQVKELTKKPINWDSEEVVGAAAPTPAVTKSRSIYLDSSAREELVELGFLNTDMRYILDTMLVKGGGQAHEKATLKSLGFSSRSELQRQVKKEIVEYRLEEARKKGIDTSTVPAESFLTKSDVKTIKQCVYLGDVVLGDALGTFSDHPLVAGSEFVNKTMNTLSCLNVTTLLGKMLLGVVEDWALTANNRGLGIALKELALAAVIKSSSPYFKMNKQLLAAFNIGATQALGSGGRYSFGMTGWLRRYTDKFANFTGVNRLDDKHALFAANAHAVLLARDILHGSATIRNTGLSKSTISKLKKAIETFSEIVETDEGKVVTDTAVEMFSKEEQVAFMGELKRRVSKEVISVNSGDVPLFFRTPVGRLLTMFKSFSSAINNQIVIPMIKQKEYSKLAGLFVYGMGFGALTTAFRGIISNNPYDYDSGEFWEAVVGRLPLGLLLDGADFAKSGIEGIFGFNERAGGDILHTLAKGGNLNWAVRALNVATGFKGEFTESKLKNLIGILPFNNLLQISPILDFAIKPWLVEKFGLKRSKTRHEKNLERKLREYRGY